MKNPFLLCFYSLLVAFPGIALVVKHYDKIEAFCESNQLYLGWACVIGAVYLSYRGAKNYSKTGRLL